MLLFLFHIVIKKDGVDLFGMSNSQVNYGIDTEKYNPSKKFTNYVKNSVLTVKLLLALVRMTIQKIR
jgi:hypothetical protein